ncbi:eukaryotic translation elongation factor 1 epsilon-1 [Manacus vitellinus]|uniref:eukaryotic translation elongation factor 1 epsilon-1 n=1 Tax=Manacus vitellinus TaxID=328815 RepID=UPI00115E3EEA|nr:eukaryotic translation elongation factor 1 epsilon-1 [Manacus vitellinus]
MAVALLAQRAAPPANGAGGCCLLPALSRVYRASRWQAAAPGAVELELLERLLGLPAGNKYGVQGERKVPVLQTNNGPGLTGLMTIAAHLVRQAKKEQLLGNTAEEKAVVQQWLEYRVTRVNGGSSKEDTRVILKDLNMHLEDKVYLAGNIFTLADILMYYGLHHIMVDLTVQEKEKYLNVSRWFNHIQHYPGVRQHLSNVVFIKNRLYTNAH